MTLVQRPGSFGYLRKEEGTLHYEYRVPDAIFDALFDVEQKVGMTLNRASGMCYPHTADFERDLQLMEDLRDPKYTTVLANLRASYAADVASMRKRNRAKIQQAQARRDRYFEDDLLDMPVCLVSVKTRGKTIGHNLVLLDIQHHERFHAWCQANYVRGEYPFLYEALMDFVFPPGKPEIMTNDEFMELMDRAENYDEDQDKVVEEIFARVNGARYAVSTGISKKWLTEDERFVAVNDLTAMQWGDPLGKLAEAVARMGVPTAEVYRNIAREANSIAAQQRRGRR